MSLPNPFPQDIPRRPNRGDRANRILETPHAPKVLAVNAPWRLSLSQHMFSAFMWSIAGKVPSRELYPAGVDPRAFNVDNPNTWNSPALKSEKLQQMAREIQSTGLGTLEQIYLSIIPPLSCESKLSSEAIVGLIQQKVSEYEVNCRWGKASKTYLQLLDMCEKRRPADRFVYRAAAATIEFLTQAGTHPLAEDPDERGGNYGFIGSEFEKKLKALGYVNVNLREIYMRPCQSGQYYLFGNKYPGGERGNEKPNPAKLYDFENSTDAFGWTESHYGVMSGSGPILDDFNMANIAGKTLLHYAAMEGNGTVVRTLLDGGAKTNVRGRDGTIPLHWAARLWYSEIALDLLEKESPPNALDNAERTPLHLAAWGGHAKTDESLGNRTKIGAQGMIELLLERNADINTKDNYGKTPLSLAAKGGFLEAMKLLLEKDADINTRDNYGKTPLSLAPESGFLEAVKLLLENDADINTKDNYGQTSLSLAAESGYLEVVKLLLEKGADPDSKDESDRAPLLLAVKGGSLEVFKLLLEKSADPDSNSGFYTPLSLAADKGNLEVVTLLLEKGVNPDSKGKRGHTPLLFAARNRHLEVVKLLLEKDIDLNSTDSSGQAPISFAAMYGHLEIAKLLLGKGADPNHKAISSETPLSLAAKGGFLEVVKHLKATLASRSQPPHLAAMIGS